MAKSIGETVRDVGTVGSVVRAPWEGTPRLSPLLEIVSSLHGVNVSLDRGEAAPAEAGVAQRTIAVGGRRVSLCVVPDTGMLAQVEAVADLVGEAVRADLGSQAELDSLSEEIADKYEELNVLYDLGEKLSPMHDEREIGSCILSEAVRVIGGERSCVLLREPGGRALVVAASTNLDEKERALRILPGEGISGFVSETGKSVQMEDASRPPKEITTGRDGSWADRSIVSPPLLAVPLRAGADPVGVLVLTHKAFNRPFTSRDLKLAQAIASQAALFIENSTYLRRIREADRIQREVEIARSIQQGLLPRQDPTIPGLDVAGLCRPAFDVGGDYFGYLDVLPDTTGIAVMDVSGHSIAAAVCMASIRGVLRCEAWSRRSSREVMERVNDLVCRDLEDGGMFATMFYGLYDQKSGEFRYTNAGHPPALLLRVGERRCRRLAMGGMGIGIAPRQAYREESLKLVRGDVLLLYSDGITDARSQSGTLFGESRLAQVLDKYRGAASWEILTSVMGEVEAFVGNGIQADDIAIVVLRVTGSS